MFIYYVELSNADELQSAFLSCNRINVVPFLPWFLPEGIEHEEKGGFANLQGTSEKGLQVFTFKQLHSATGGFSKSNVVGHGSFGSVYRGVLSDGRKVAVKLMHQAGKQGEEEFKVEVLGNTLLSSSAVSF